MCVTSVTYYYMNHDIKQPNDYELISSLFRGNKITITRDKNEQFANQTDEDEIDLRHYWHSFTKHKWIILGLTLLIGLLTTVVAFSLQPIYRSTAVLLIEFDKANVIPIEDIYGVSSFRKEYFQTQLEILKYQNLAEKVVKKLNLVSHSVFNQAPQPGFDWHQWLPSVWLPQPLKPEDKYTAVVNAVMAQLNIAPIRNSQLVNISFISKDAQLAADVPNTLAALYIESDLEARLAMTHKAAAWLTERMEGLRQKLRASEKKLQAYMERQNLVNVAGVKSVAARQIEETASNLVNVRMQLAKAENVYQQVQQLRVQSIEKSTKAFESLPAVLNHPLVQRLKTAELDAARKVSELSERYGQKHPSIIAAQAELTTAIYNTAEQIKQVIEGITKEYELAFANVKALEQALIKHKRKIQTLNQKEYQLKVLEREVEVNRQLYHLFLTRFKETDASQDLQMLQSTVGRVVQPALVSQTPYKPKKKLIVGISLILGFLFSTLLAFLLEYLDNTIKNREDVEDKLVMPLLGTLPALKLGPKDELSPRWMYLKVPRSPFAESIRTIRTGIMLSGLDTPQKVLVVTSSVVGEGKTTFAINQAFALGQMEKTLLIDADMRRPSVGKSFGLSTKAPGLSELVAGTQAFDKCIHHLGEEGGVDVIPSGMVPPNPLELLSSQRFKEILDKLVQSYRYIIIDTAPTMIVSDAMVLAKYASEVLYIVKADATPYPVVRDGLKRLHQVEVLVQNMVLNYVDTNKSSTYGYGKYGYRQGYYGEYA